MNEEKIKARITRYKWSIAKLIVLCAFGVLGIIAENNNLIIACFVMVLMDSDQLLRKDLEDLEEEIRDLKKEVRSGS